jgi:hypothetical protein
MTGQCTFIGVIGLSAREEQIGSYQPTMSRHVTKYLPRPLFLARPLSLSHSPLPSLCPGCAVARRQQGPRTSSQKPVWILIWISRGTYCPIAALTGGSGSTAMRSLSPACDADFFLPQRRAYCLAAGHLWRTLSVHRTYARGPSDACPVYPSFFGISVSQQPRRIDEAEKGALVVRERACDGTAADLRGSALSGCGCPGGTGAHDSAS